MGFRIKLLLAYLFDKMGISSCLFRRLGKRYRNNYIRVVNYHDIKDQNIENFRKQIEFFSSIYENVSYQQFKKFLSAGKLCGSKPGIMITFDDGLIGNYLNAYKILQEYNMTGFFMVSPDLIGEPGYMSKDQISDLLKYDHVIGSHTCTHHRMNFEDTDEVLEYEIHQSKEKLEEMFECPVEIFCWCGGEEKHYTKRASDTVKQSGYKYAFLTNSFPVVRGTNPFHIQRINIEDSWPIQLVRLQISGFMDLKFRNKRLRVDALIK